MTAQYGCVYLQGSFRSAKVCFGGRDSMDRIMIPQHNLGSITLFPIADIGVWSAFGTNQSSAARLHRFYGQKKTAPDVEAVLGDYVRLWLRWVQAALSEELTLPFCLTPTKAYSGQAETH